MQQTNNKPIMYAVEAEYVNFRREKKSGRNYQQTRNEETEFREKKRETKQECQIRQTAKRIKRDEKPNL
jgi:hypothetical protein